MKPFILTILLCSVMLNAMPDLKSRVGTPQTMLEALNRDNTKVSSMYTFVSSSSEKISANVEDFYYKDGYLSMSGTVKGSENSRFMLKGSEKRIYGWVALKDKNIAYEYTTNSLGEVMVEKVPVSRVITVCNIHPPEDYYYNPAESINKKRAKSPAWVKNIAPHIGDYDGVTSLHELESLPGSDKVMYMDITKIMNGEDPITLNSKDEIWYTWQSVAASLSMFDINVTTNKTVYDEVGSESKGIATFLNQSGRSNADMNSFGGSGTSRNYKNNGQGYGLGRTAAHEIGHQMGLRHDGSPGNEYFPGLKDWRWCPIMGNYWYGDSWGDDALYQYSLGEYSQANQQEDDLDLVGNENNVNYREDDIPTSVPLTLNGTAVSPEDNYGQIAMNTDSDEFTFSIGEGGGSVSLTVSRIEYIGGGMLDVALELKDEPGSVIAESNPEKVRSATVDETLDKGDYTLVVMGGAEGTPSDGFSNYSSLGFYSIEGTIDGGITGTIKNSTIGKSNIKVRPVVNGSRINLDIPANTRVKDITVYSTNGSIIYNSQTKVSSIDLSDAAAGIYVLRIDFNGGKMVKNIVKR